MNFTKETKIYTVLFLVLLLATAISLFVVKQKDAKQAREIAKIQLENAREAIVKAEKSLELLDVASAQKLIYVVKDKEAKVSLQTKLDTIKQAAQTEDAKRHPLKDVKILTIGDSLTWLDGQSETGGGTHIGYQQALRDAGASVTSLGNSGATYRKYDAKISNMKHGSLYDDIVEKQISVHSYDVITLFAMTNDVARGWIPGSLDKSNRDVKTSIGALREVLDYIKKKNPTAHVILFTPIPSSAASRPENLMIEATDTIIQIAQEYQLPVVDMYRTSGIDQSNLATYLYDGTHPNNAGFQIIGAKFLSEIRNVLQK